MGTVSGALVLSPSDDYTSPPSAVSRRLTQSSSYDYMASSEDNAWRRKCKRYLGKSVVALALGAADAGCIIVRRKNYSSTASTGALLGVGFLSTALLKEVLPKHTFKAINGFTCRWSFEIFEFLTQFNLNRKDFAIWCNFDPDLIKTVTLALIAAQAGHAMFSETYFALTSSPPIIPRRNSGDLSINPRPTNKLLGLPRNNRGLFITQTTKLAAAIGLIAFGIFACENAPNARFVCENGGTYLGSHAIGMIAIQKYLDNWEWIKDEYLEMMMPDPPGYRRENPTATAFQKTKSRASCCFRVLNGIHRACILLRQPFIGSILYIAENSRRFNIISSAIIGSSGAIADGKHRYEFESGNSPYENPIPQTREGTWCQRKYRDIREHCSDPNNVVKDVLLIGMLAWFAYGIGSLDDTAPKIGIILLLSSLFVGYGVTKVVDRKFRNLESTPALNSLYYHLLVNPDYVLLFFAYLKSLSGRMGKSAYTSSNNALIADLGWISLGLAAGNNRASQYSSQPSTDRVTPIAKTVLAYVIFEMFADRLS